MLSAIVPASKVGTAFQSPNWRYQAAHSPSKFGFDSFLSKPNPNAGHLSRLIPNGIKPVQAYFQPIYMKQLKKELPYRLSRVLDQVWDSYFYRTNPSKLIFNNLNPKESGFICWNMAKLQNLNDAFFKRLVMHCYNYQGDTYINDALKFYKDPNNNVSIKWINYSIYGGKFAMFPEYATLF
jgi:hypothetical protein